VVLSANRLSSTTSAVSNRGVALHALFVCTGNICRSPIAERLAIAYAVRLHIQDFSASSAGTRAVIGHPIHPNAARVLEQRGGDACNYAARQLKPKMTADADVILTMTSAHRNAVLELAPHQLARTFTLIEAARLISECGAQNLANLAKLRPHLAPRGDLDIPDPIGQTPAVFEAVGGQIADLLPPILGLCQRS